MTAKAKPDQENPFLNLAFNIIIPVVILNKLTKYFGDNGPLIALLVALSFPIFYGVYDYIKRKKKNVLSLLGIINVLMTGGLALLHIEGIWFAVKEAAFPLILGVAVYISSYTKKPLMQFMIADSHVVNFDLIKERLQEAQKEGEYKSHIKNSTKLLAVSFFISSLLNFILARRIFVDIDSTLSELEHSTVLNEQIAQMTWLSFIVIVLPLMIFMIFILWHLFSGIKKLTHLDMNDVLIHQK